MGNPVKDEIVDEEYVFRVGAGSDPIALATVIVNELKKTPEVILRAIGVGAVNQAAKAVAIARGFVAGSGKDLVTRVGFQTVSGKYDDDISALVFRCVAH